MYLILGNFEIIDSLNIFIKSII